MRIINGDILVRGYDRFGSIEIIGCRITCDFPLFVENYEAPKLFEFRGAFDDKSEDFKLVFENTSMEACIITGTDNPSP
jgi:hypothetical protein